MAPSAELSTRDSIAIGVFGTWMATGLYLDGWAHIHQKPETFFSPWHGVLYSGFAAAVAFFTLDGMVRRRRGADRPLPPAMLLGLGLFGLGAVGDFVWHEIFGIEVDLEALLSPTHLALLAGGVLMVSGPFRSAWRTDTVHEPGWRAFAPVLASITLSTAAASFFLMYLSAFRFGGLSSDPGFLGILQQTHGIASVLTTNLLLLVPTLLVLKRWRPPGGALVVLYVAVALGMVGMDGLRWPLLLVPGFIGGLTADCIGRRYGARWTAGVVPLAMWSTWFAAVEGSTGVGWPPELVAGTVILATMSGIVVGVLSDLRAPSDAGAHLVARPEGDEVVDRDHRQPVVSGEGREVT